MHDFTQKQQSKSNSIAPSYTPSKPKHSDIMAQRADYLQQYDLKDVGKTMQAYYQRKLSPEAKQSYKLDQNIHNPNTHSLVPEVQPSLDESDVQESPSSVQMKHEVQRISLAEQKPASSGIKKAPSISVSSMNCGEKLVAAAEMVPNLLVGDIKEAFKKLIHDPSFTASIIGLGAAFAALQAIPIAGEIADIIVVLFAAFTGGWHFGSYLLKGCTANSKEDLISAAIELKQVIEIVGVASLAGLIAKATKILRIKAGKTDAEPSTPVGSKGLPTSNVKLEREKPSKEGSINSADKTTLNKGESSSNPVRINIHDRLQEFYSQLRALPKAKTAKEGLKQVIHTLDKVEDELSGIEKKNPHLHQVNQTEECIHHKKII